VAVAAAHSLESLMTRLRRSWIHWCRRPPGEDASAHLLVGEGLVRLNSTAALIWEQLECAPGRPALFRRMRRRYKGVEDRRLQQDLDRTLEEWIRQCWIEEQDDPVFPFPEETWPI
jgi:hypothetical protein